MKRILLFLALLLFPSISSAQNTDCPIRDKGGICLSKEDKEKLIAAIRELDSIHSAPAEITIEPITIVRDWQNRVYINGQEGKPLRLKLKIGETIDRDLEVQLPVQLSYREAPPPPMFRLRIRAQLGLLSTPLLNIAEDSDNIANSIDGGIGWDWFGVSNFNSAIYTGIRGFGPQVGYDLTKNFGITGGFHIIYDGLKGTGALQFYFSFN